MLVGCAARSCVARGTPRVGGCGRAQPARLWPRFFAAREESSGGRFSVSERRFCAEHHLRQSAENSALLLSRNRFPPPGGHAPGRGVCFPTPPHPTPSPPPPLCLPLS